MKRHHTPLTGPVSAEPHQFARLRVGAQQPRGQSGSLSDHRGAQCSGVAIDQLRVQPRPGGVAVALMSVAAGEAGGRTGPDERADHHRAPFERHREVCGVVSKVTRELDGRRRTLQQDHGDILTGGTVAHGDVLIGESLPHPMRRTPVGDVQGLDPRRSRRRGIVDEERAELREQHPRFLSWRADAVSDDIECGATEAGAHPTEQQLDPRRGNRDADIARDAELEGGVVPPQQGDVGVEARQSGGGER
ncbi:hypothetical protein [Microbacterium sp. NPDC087591]|uniref:hypothetical protein n=1 Tax=Microbacterium sp. NPDC087591 TaxID=3364192 RepID=UPI003810E5D0